LWQVSYRCRRRHGKALRKCLMSTTRCSRHVSILRGKPVRTVERTVTATPSQNLRHIFFRRRLQKHPNYTAHNSRRQHKKHHEYEVHHNRSCSASYIRYVQHSLLERIEAASYQLPASYQPLRIENG
jgi:hypothetical protein